MAPLKWQPSYELGISIIDEQHRSLLDLINQLEEENLNSELDTEETLNKLINYIRFHFAEEEKLMGMNNYHDFDKHSERHQKFIRHISGFLKTSQQRETIPPETITSFLKTWLNSHILGEVEEFSFFCQPIEK